MNDVNFEARVLALAELEQRIAARRVIAIEMMNLFYKLYVEPYETELANLAEQIEQERERLKEDFLQHVLTTGDLDAHPSLQFTRRKRWVYDKQAVLQAAQAHGATDFIRTKQELDVRAFEKALKAGEIEWADAEVINDPYVVIRPLGEVLIRHEMEE